MSSLSSRVVTEEEISFTTFSNIINGQPRSSSRTHHGIDPVTLEELWPVPIASEKDVDDAVRAANEAWTSWKQVPIEKRKEMLVRYREVYEEHLPQFKELLMKETGKPAKGAAGELGSLKSLFKAHENLTLPTETLSDKTKTITIRHVPLGVVGAICPWNFPLFLSTAKIVPALLAGCTIIVKPSPYTPYTTLKMVELAQRIFPPGVVQAVGGDDSVGPLLTHHEGIAKISFTGSIATGKKIMAACAGSLKRVTLELGGNDASIVCEDVDVEKVAPQLVMGALANSGQVCVATKRIYIHEKIYTKTLAAMTSFAAKMKVGSDANSDLGPIQNAMQYEKVRGFYSDVQQQGYKFALGGAEEEDSSRPRRGYFVQPAIIDNPPDDSRIVAEEPFGPIFPCMPFSTYDEAIRRANSTNTGLGACVWSADEQRGYALAERLEAGSVFVNSWEKLDPSIVFGGHKESGMGGEFGLRGLLGYCNTQAIHHYKTRAKL